MEDRKSEYIMYTGLFSHSAGIAIHVPINQAVNPN